MSPGVKPGKGLSHASPLSLSSAHSGASFPLSQGECDTADEAQVEDTDLGSSAGPVLSPISYVTSGEFVCPV